MTNYIARDLSTGKLCSSNGKLITLRPLLGTVSSNTFTITYKKALGPAPPWNSEFDYYTETYTFVSSMSNAIMPITIWNGLGTTYRGAGWGIRPDPAWLAAGAYNGLLPRSGNLTLAMYTWGANTYKLALVAKFSVAVSIITHTGPQNYTTTKYVGIIEDKNGKYPPLPIVWNPTTQNILDACVPSDPLSWDRPQDRILTGGISCTISA